MAIKEFKKEIMKEWEEMTDEGILFWCLNLRVTHDRQRVLFKIDQTQYVDEILLVSDEEIKRSVFTFIESM